MKMPSVTISFTEAATAAVKRGERGIIAMILKDIVPAENPVRCVTEEDIPLLLSVGKENLYVWEKQEGMLHENEAAEILREICH